MFQSVTRHRIECYATIREWAVIRAVSGSFGAGKEEYIVRPPPVLPHFSLMTGWVDEGVRVEGGDWGLVGTFRRIKEHRIIQRGLYSIYPRYLFKDGRGQHESLKKGKKKTAVKRVKNYLAGRGNLTVRPLLKRLVWWSDCEPGCYRRYQHRHWKLGRARVSCPVGLEFWRRVEGRRWWARPWAALRPARDADEPRHSRTKSRRTTEHSAWRGRAPGHSTAARPHDSCRSPAALTMTNHGLGSWCTPLVIRKHSSPTGQVGRGPSFYSTRECRGK